jgi:hypothetical protein
VKRKEVDVKISLGASELLDLKKVDVSGLKILNFEAVLLAQLESFFLPVWFLM